VGASSLSRRALVPPWGSNPRPQDRAAALPRACGRSAPDCVLGRWVAARSVRESHGLQRGRVGVERQQRLVHGRQCVRPRLHTVPRCPRLRSPAGGSHAPPAALGRCLGGGRGESIPCLRELWVVVVGSSPTVATDISVRRLTRGLRGGWGARSVLQRLGLQRGPVGVECWQRPVHGRQCVRPRLHTAPNCPRCVHPSRGMSLSTPFTGIQSPPAAAERCIGRGGGVGAPSLSRRALVPPWGSNPRPQDRSAALPRACGCAAPQGVRGAWGACAQCLATPPARASASTARSSQGATTAARTIATRAASRAPEPLEADGHLCIYMHRLDTARVHAQNCISRQSNEINDTLGKWGVASHSATLYRVWKCQSQLISWVLHRPIVCTRPQTRSSIFSPAVAG
jgi:hypothetical protein